MSRLKPLWEGQVHFLLRSAEATLALPQQRDPVTKFSDSAHKDIMSQSSTTIEVVVKRGLDRDCRTTIVKLGDPIRGVDPHTRREGIVFAWRVECEFHGTRELTRTRRQAEFWAHRPGAWCNECRDERPEERE